MGKLGDWANKNRVYLKIEDGETVSVLYLGCKVVQSSFDPEQETVQYSFEVGGDPKLFESRSLVFADKFDKIDEGSWVKITRNGKGRATEYKVEPFDLEGKEDVKPDEVKTNSSS